MHLADLVTIRQLLEALQLLRGMVSRCLRVTDLVAKCMRDKKGRNER